MRAKLMEIKAQLKRQMHSTVAEIGAWLRSVVRGWLNYHAVPGNSLSLGRFLTRWAASGLAFYDGAVRNFVADVGNMALGRFATGELPPARILHPYPNERLAVR